jgi:hypothetical protein
MPRYFFDVNDGRPSRDEEGIECANLQAAVIEAKKLLPEISREQVPKDGERLTVTVLVSDEDGHPVYSGLTTYTGSWLTR